jgi:clathrin heavy chain
MGLLFVYDIQKLTAVYRQRISADPVFLACAAPSTGGVYVITRRGSILFANVNKDTMVPFISTSLKNIDLAIRIAMQGNLPGAEPLFQQKFDQVCASLSEVVVNYSSTRTFLHTLAPVPIRALGTIVGCVSSCLMDLSTPKTLSRCLNSDLCYSGCQKVGVCDPMLRRSVNSEVWWTPQCLKTVICNPAVLYVHAFMQSVLQSQKCVQECNEGKFKEAAETAANAPSDALRTQATITRLQSAPTVAGQKSPLIVYFGSLLQKGKLNTIESVEMSRIALSQNRPDLVSNWLRDDKLTPSEPLGDLLKEVCPFALIGM